jgi:hypothetical protein
MPPWEGAETADITYSDADGELTSYLIDQGYLKDCQGIRPKYYLEVKTTTKGCRTPFYMSKHQFARVSLPSFSSYFTCYPFHLLPSGHPNEQAIGLKTPITPTNQMLTADAIHARPQASSYIWFCFCSEEEGLHNYPRVQSGPGKYGRAAVR